MADELQTRFKRLTFRTLSSYLAVCHHQNLSAAAEHLGLAKSAVSEACSLMESVLGVPLFERHAHGMLPNEHGELVAQYAWFVGNLAQYAQRATGQSAHELGYLTVKIPARFWGAGVNSALMQAIEACAQLHPQVLIWPELLGQSNIDESLGHVEAGLSWAEHHWRPSWPQVGRVRLSLRDVGDLPDEHEALLQQPWFVLSPAGSGWPAVVGLAQLKTCKLILPRMPWPMLQQIANYCLREHLSFEHSSDNLATILSQKNQPDVRVLYNGVLLDDKDAPHWHRSRLNEPLHIVLASKSRGTHPIVHDFKAALLHAWAQRESAPPPNEVRTRLKQWRYWGEILRKGSISAAANGLFVSQSALSVQLQQFEQGLNTRLIERKTGTRRLHLTPAGEVVRQIHSGLMDVLHMVGQYAQQQHLQQGRRLILGVLPSIDAHSRLVELIVHRASTWLRRYPQVQLEIVEERHVYLMHALRNQAIHFAVTEVDAPWVRQVEIGESEAMGLVIATSLLPANCPAEMDWQALNGLPLVLPRQGSGMRTLIDSHCLSLGITLQPCVESDSLNINRAWIAQGRYGSILPRSAVASLLESGDLRFIPLQPSLSRVLRLAYLGHRVLSPIEAGLLAYLTGL
ncbi:MAG: LysR family transcriptional regulator [Formosimonas sp.]